MITLGKGKGTFDSSYYEDDCTGFGGSFRPFDGVKFQGEITGMDAESHWGVDGPSLSSRKMNEIVQTVADWYVCGAISSGALGPINFDPELLDEFKVNGKIKIGNATPQVKAVLEYATLTARLESVFSDYLFYACARESRYLDTVAQVIGSYDYTACYGWRLYYDHFGPLKTASLLKRCFDDNNVEWESDFGGKSWKEIAGVLKAYYLGTLHGLPFTAENFIDITVSLEHNNGCVLNKINWDENQIIASWSDDPWHFRFARMCEAQANDLDQLANEHSSTRIRNIYRKVIANNA